MRRRGEPVLDLTLSNPTQAGIPYAGVDILAALADPGVLTYEPHAAGLPAARDAVATATGVSRERILLTASTSEAYSYLFKLLCDPGDEVLVPRPSYPLFEYLAALDGVRVRQYPLAYHEGWWMDLDFLRGAVGPRTRAIVVVNPNNPTGSYLKRAELDALAAIGLPLLSDEVFHDFAFGSDPERVRTVADEERIPCFALGGLSKSAGLPQVKLGWIIHNGEAGIREKLELIADTYLSVSAPVQHAAARLLDLGGEWRGSMMQRLRRNLAAVPEALRVEGGWYAILRLPRTRSEEEWVLQLLGDHGVLTQPGYFYDFESEAFAVVSLLTPPEEFEEGVRRIRAAASDS